MQHDRNSLNISRQPDRLSSPLTAAAATGLTASRSRTLSQARASEPGNTPSAARDLGRFPGRRSAADAVGRLDPDYYKITAVTLSDINIAFRNRSRRAISVVLNDVLGNVVRGAGIPRTVKAGQSINQVYTLLPSGTYYLSVKSSGQGNRYRLSVAVSKNVDDCGCG